MDEIIWLDFETEAIEDGAPLLPEPVGCAILGDKYPDGHYFAWGHPEGNNCTKEEFGAYLASIWDKRLGTQNGCTFDIPIAGHHFGLPERDPLLTEDTLFLIYLHDPHARSLSLKDIAADWLGIPPDEQQDLYDWTMANVPDCRSRKQCGAYIAKAPASMVGPYAVGDVVRTKAVYEYVAPLVLPIMQEPYDRERRLAPVLADIQNRGVRCDVTRLEADYHKATHKLHQLDGLIREHLNAPPEFNPGSDKELGAMLAERGYSGFLLTPSGKPSMNKESLNKVLEADPALRSLLHSRNTYATLTGTFMGPWLWYAEQNGGRIHAAYNQVRNPEGYGTRTGRLSSSKPNFQNVPNDLGLDHWGEPFPIMRSYLLPEEGHVWVCADAKNQEPRLAAHFEDGALLAAFLKDVMLDPYLFVGQVARVERKPAKVVLLGLLYAMGAATLAERLGSSVEFATAVRVAVKAALPDVVQLDFEAKKRWMQGLPIKTLGGRLYYCEPPSNGRRWEYKALNTLIQGSAADQTKEAIIYMNDALNNLWQSAYAEAMTERYREAVLKALEAAGCRILGTVHDEISVSCPAELVENVKAVLQDAINALPCDCPMMMDFGVGANWAEAK